MFEEISCMLISVNGRFEKETLLIGRSLEVPAPRTSPSLFLFKEEMRLLSFP
jgi:hypothetical protein